MAWIKLDCLAEMRLRFRELALRLTGGAKQAPRIGMDRISLNHLSIELFSLEKSARLVMLLGLNKCLGNVGHRSHPFMQDSMPLQPAPSVPPPSGRTRRSIP